MIQSDTVTCASSVTHATIDESPPPKSNSLIPTGNHGTATRRAHVLKTQRMTHEDKNTTEKKNK